SGENGLTHRAVSFEPGEQTVKEDTLLQTLAATKRRTRQGQKERGRVRGNFVFWIWSRAKYNRLVGQRSQESLRGVMSSRSCRTFRQGENHHETKPQNGPDDPPGPAPN